MTTELSRQQVDDFLRELTELSRRHKINIWACGCCGSPRLGVCEDGQYTIDEPDPDPKVYEGDWSGLKWNHEDPGQGQDQDQGREKNSHETEITTCPARMNQLGPWPKDENLDRWEKRGPDRVCSFCGSMHPDQFMALAETCRIISREARMPERHLPVRIWVEQSDKPHKFYTHRPGVANASQGAIKFHGYHLNPIQADRLRELLSKGKVGDHGKAT